MIWSCGTHEGKRDIRAVFGADHLEDITEKVC